jgi:hypothetical protein
MITHEGQQLVPVGCRSSDDARNSLSEHSIRLRRQLRCQEGILVRSELRMTSNKYVESSCPKVIWRARIRSDLLQLLLEPWQGPRPDQLQGPAPDICARGFDQPGKRPRPRSRQVLEPNTLNRLEQKYGLLLAQCWVGEQLRD